MNTILHINAEMNWAGGEVQTLLLTEKSVSSEYRHVIACPPDSQLSQRAKEKGLEVFEIPMRSFGDVFAVWRLSKLMTDLHVDIVHMHTYLAHYLGACAATIAGVSPNIVTRRMNFPIEHSVLNYWLYNLSMKRVVAISQSVERCLWDYVTVKDKIVTIPSAIAIDKEKPWRARMGTSETSTITIGTVCHLIERKGVQYLLQAAARILRRFPQVKLLIVGDGPLRQSLENLAAEHGIEDKVCFRGFQECVQAELEKMDIFVMASLEEALGVAILEAMAAGTPVVATNVGGIPEIVEHGKSGLLVPSRDSEAIYRAVTLLLSNPDKLSQYAAHGYAFVSRHHCAELMVADYERIYNSLLEREIDHS